MTPALSIVVPARNEAGRLGRMLDAYLPVLRARRGGDFELLVVVNGSTDGTADLARGYVPTYPQVRVLENPAPIGKGGAVMWGMREARGRWIGFVDADGATPPDAFLELVERIGDAGAIIASRWCAGARITLPPWPRRAASRVFNGLVRLLFRLPITDTQCGAKLLTAEAAHAVAPRLGTTQWAFDVDLLFQLRRAGFALREIPTEWHDVAGSHLRIPRASVEMTLAITRLRLRHSRGRWIVSVYDRTIGPWIHGRRR